MGPCSRITATKEDIKIYSTQSILEDYGGYSVLRFLTRVCSPGYEDLNILDFFPTRAHIDFHRGAKGPIRAIANDLNIIRNDDYGTIYAVTNVNGKHTSFEFYKTPPKGK